MRFWGGRPDAAQARDAKLTARGLDIVARNTRLQTQLISILLDISRIVAGKLRLDMQRVDLASMIDAAIEAVQPARTRREFASTVRSTPSLGRSRRDPARLQQVVWNLLSNALKFTPAATGDGHLARAGSQAEIVVEDNGAGIRPDFLPHVFDRSSRPTRPARGDSAIGPGISIVKNLDRVSRRDRASRERRRWTRRDVYVSIPLGAPRICARTRSSRCPGHEHGDSALANVRVLVVERRSRCRGVREEPARHARRRGADGRVRA